MSVAKAQQAMTAPPPPSNMEAQKQGFFDTCAQFGTNAGAGDTSKVGFFQATTEAAWQGIVVPATRRKKGDTTSPPTDPEIAYDTFAEARKKKAGEMGKRIAGKDGKDRKTRVAETNSMIKLGSLPLIHDVDQGGLGVFNRTLKLIREDADITGQVDDMLLEVARRQCDMPEVALTTEQIRAILAPEGESTQKPPKEEVERWDSIRKQVGKLREDFPDSNVASKAKTVENNVAAMVDDLGGTKAMAKAREAAAAAKQVQRQGAKKGRKKA